MLQALDPERMPVWSWWDVEECLDQVCEWKDRLQLEGFAAATVATRIRHLLVQFVSVITARKDYVVLMSNVT